MPSDFVGIAWGWALAALFLGIAVGVVASGILQSADHEFDSDDFFLVSMQTKIRDLEEENAALRQRIERDADIDLPLPPREGER